MLNQIKSFISGNTAHRKTKKRQKHRNTLRITSRQKDRQTKLSKLSTNYKLTTSTTLLLLFLHNTAKIYSWSNRTHATSLTIIMSSTCCNIFVQVPVESPFWKPNWYSSASFTESIWPISTCSSSFEMAFDIAIAR